MRQTSPNSLHSLVSPPFSIPFNVPMAVAPLTGSTKAVGLPSFPSPMTMSPLTLDRNSLGRGQRLGQVQALKTFSLPDLPYDYRALEPLISGEIMELHHLKHHLTYITNYYKALHQLDEAISKGDSSSILRLQSSIKFNGGGHINHSIFRKNLAPVIEGGGEPPNGLLGVAFHSSYGSLEALMQKINAEGAALQGSGWVWLALDKEMKRLQIETTQNQDPLVTKGPNLVPLLGIDVWEHAYYLQYKNVEADYLKNIWKVMNWKYASCMRKRVPEDDLKIAS
ncbi:superoxide dismutase [Mn], mitochondrial-like [Vitis riparia]|uniref:superoxide dismutase [Mn], mitochondrial-like n=1 Tax=Vitis riparia TaxID=96939 RepID=UPI00155ACC95|nr:superoxide dismutase [Mn], mitochondrial-like [Vitis riparia]